MSSPTLFRGLLSLWLLCFPVAAQDVIDIDRIGDPNQAIPVALKGFSGEAASVLRFDLSIQGFKFVPENEAQYVIFGSNEGSFKGWVKDRVNGHQLLGRSYQSGSLRLQAHSFSDDVVRAVARRPGIARTRIAFKVRNGRRYEVYVADYDGHRVAPVTNDGVLVYSPAWFPSHPVLYYTSYRLGNPDIYAQDLPSGKRQIVARYSGLNTAPAISPDGRHLAMILSKAGSPDLWVAGTDGSNPRRLTTTRETEASPCWSPDSKTICFVSDERGRPALYTIPVGGGEMKRLRTVGVYNATEPDWSPDGKWIAFTTQRGGNVFEICIAPAGGGEVQVLVNGENPSWASNSRNLIFSTPRGGRKVLSLLDVPTKEVKYIDQIKGSATEPSWAK